MTLRICADAIHDQIETCEKVFGSSGGGFASKANSGGGFGAAAQSGNSGLIHLKLDCIFLELWDAINRA